MTNRLKRKCSFILKNSKQKNLYIKKQNNSLVYKFKENKNENTFLTGFSSQNLTNKKNITLKRHFPQFI